jgi:glycosyltransferase involved in cell wall biosynthesis
MGHDAVAIVRNGFVHDARVLRAVRTLAEAGYRPLVVAALTASGQAQEGVADGVAIVRVRPSRPVAWIARRFEHARPPTAQVAGAADARGGRGAALALRAFRSLRTFDYHWRAARVVVSRRPALVHCNDHNTMWVGLAARLLTHSRVVYDAHELWPDRNGRWEWRPWLLATEAVFTRLADEVIVASPGFVAPMTRRYRIPAPRVVRNVPSPAPSPRGLAPSPTVDGAEDPLVVYVGTLLAERGLEQAIDAVALVPGVRLRLIGHGGGASAASALIDRARQAGIGDRFEIRAPIHPDRVVEALRGASVGLSLFQHTCLSHERTLPNKLFEYVAAGVPVLTSDVELSAEFVRRHGVGEVVPAADPAAIARGLSALLEPGRQEALRPRIERAAREHSWERERAALLEAYASAVGRGP